jgi:hypothetical protein
MVPAALLACCKFLFYMHGAYIQARLVPHSGLEMEEYIQAARHSNQAPTTSAPIIEA